MHRFSFLLVLCLGFYGLVAQTTIRYRLDLSDIRHHELNISVQFEAVPEGPFTLRMPTSSPGRYAEHNFAKNVYDVRAYDGENNSLEVVKTNVSEWQVTGHDGKVDFRYTLFGNRADGTYTGIDNRKVHMNMPATFVYGLGMEGRRIELNIDLADHPDWKIATQLERVDANTFRAPNYYYFYDSPTIVGSIDFRSWTSASDGKDYTIEVAMDHEGTDQELDAYVEWVKRIVEEQKAVFGGLPDFDFGKYTFLCTYNPWVSGDGMEHRNSTVCSSSGNLATSAGGLIGTVSHEFFHAWNVERIRPQSLEPFDFDRANMSDALWFAEGFTSYYTGLILCRAGIRSEEEYVGSLTGVLNFILNSPARKYRGPAEMSKMAPFVDAARSVDPTNYQNTFISYYSYGSFLGLALDLTLRYQFPGVSLDDYMQYMWEHYGQPEIPYNLADLTEALAEVTGDLEFARDFFARYIHGSEVPDMNYLLSQFGLVLKPRNPGQNALVNLRLEPLDEGFAVKQFISENHPLYEAGINEGDVILSIEGWDGTTNGLRALKIGSTYEVVYLQNGLRESGNLTLTADPTLEVGLLEAIYQGETPTQPMLERREAWLKSKQ